MPENLKPYPAYKDSGVPWLGQVPEQWESNRLGHVSTLMVPMRDKPEDLTGPMPWIRIEDLNGRSIASSQSGQGVSADTIRAMNLKVFPVGTVLCSCSCSMGTVAIAARPIVTNQTFIGIVPGVTFSSEYLFYLLQAAKDYLTQIATGAIQTYLSRSEFSSLGIVVPPLIEQMAIVRYLDHAGGKVRHAISARQRLIKLLTEQKQAIIQHAVTRGLDPNVRLKPSGVPWLGEVPERWKVRRLRGVTQTLVSNIDKHSNLGEVPVRLCNYIDVYKNERITDRLPFMQATASRDEADAFRLETGDVVITKDSEEWDDIAVPALVEYAAPDLVCGYHLAILRPRNEVVSGPYLARALQAPCIAHQFYVAANGVTRYGLSHDAIKSALVTVPPLSEQSAIVRYLDSATANLDKAIDAAHREIDLLREYRTRLIADVVTGKLDVRNVPIPDDEIDVLPEELESIDNVEATDETDDVAGGDSESSTEESA